MTLQEKIDFLGKMPLFEHLQGEDLETFANLAQFQSKPKYSYLFLSDEPADFLCILVKGSIKIGTHSADGREVIKSILHPNALFGELCLVGEERRQDFARAMNREVQFISFNKLDFTRFMRKNNTLNIKLIRLIGDRLRKAESRLESLIFKDARTRIIEFIKEAATRRGRRVGYEMLIKHSLTQQDIANLTGTSRQTVTSVLNDLRKANLIYFNRNSILVRDMTKLA